MLKRSYLQTIVFTMNTYATSHTDLKDNDNHIKQQVRLEHETKKINII